MKLKKNPKKDLNRNNNLYFIIGLVLTLFITWKVIDAKTYTKVSSADKLFIDNDNIDENDVLILPTPPPPPPPPPKPIIPDDFKVIDNESKKEETPVENTETNQDDLIDPVVTYIETPDEPEVLFIALEDKPIFPGCENVNKSERGKCFEEQLYKHIRRKFKYPEAAKEMGIQGKVFIQFVINQKGVIEIKGVRGPDKNLENEAERIISLLPKMEPGKQRGRPVKVPYSIPIFFKLQ